MIRPLRELPALHNSQGIMIHGLSQATLSADTNPAGPEIVLDGSALPGGADCLRIDRILVGAMPPQDGTADGRWEFRGDPGYADWAATSTTAS